MFPKKGGHHYHLGHHDDHHGHHDDHHGHHGDHHGHHDHKHHDHDDSHGNDISGSGKSQKFIMEELIGYVQVRSVTGSV